MLKREISKKIIELSKKYPVVTLTGARQTGKTTLLKKLYPKLPYVNLEDIDNRKLAETDPKGFLSNYPKGAVIDEVQQVPTLFSYIQQIVDSKKIHFALSGSHNFQLMQSITQSLAGRSAIFNLMPFSYAELKKGGYEFENYEEIVFKGCYPRLYDKKINPIDFYPYYISSYIERDVRLIKNIENLSAFAIFLQLCAGRSGQILNINSLATDAGISPNTAKAWLSVLEAGYIIYLIKPHHKNFNKRLIQSPKLYFYDTGLACSLLQIQSKEQLNTHFLKGGLFENFVMNEFVKHFANKGQKAPLYFWQSKEKKEIDILLAMGENLFPYEVKSSKTKVQNLFDNLKYWQKLNNTPSNMLNVIYGADDNFKTSDGNFVSWRNISKIIP